MSPEQIDLVQTSLKRALRIAPHVASTFYSELFAIDPGLRRMFKGDMSVQGRKLTEMLVIIVNGLSAPASILPTAQRLAVSHVAYGVKPEHYKLVGTALMRTLRHELGAEFTPELRAAWMSAYKMLSDVMIEAAYGAAKTAASPAP